MAENIDDIASNCFYYDDSLIYNFDQPDEIDDLIESRQIRDHMQVLIDNLNDKCLDKELPLNKMHELGTQFLKILKKRSLMIMRNQINSLTLEGTKYESHNTMGYRKRDLVTEIDEFYETFIPGIEENLESLDTAYLSNPEYSLKYTMNAFWDEAKHAINLMDDLDERIAFILHSFELTSTNIEMKRACPQKRVYLITQITERIINKFEMGRGGKKETGAMSRLYRRMSMILIEPNFLKFSPRDAKRYEMFERIAKYQDVLHREGQGFCDYAEIVRQLERLKNEIEEQSSEYLFSFTRDGELYKYSVAKPKISNYEYIKKIAIVFNKISKSFETYVKRFEMIRKLMDEAWNTEFELHSS